MDLKGKKVIVMGAGISGISAVRLLLDIGAIPVLFDENEKLDRTRVIEQLRGDEIEIVTGTLPEEMLQTASLLVMSPGIPVDTPFVERFHKAQIPVWGEIELAYQYAKGDVIAITGTNGKTTTTALTGKIMEDYYGKAYVVGNIGAPYTAAALDTKNGEVTVAEISSFQLETIHNFHPRISAILNITPDHLNRHHTMENYVACKEAVARNQTFADVCVLNYENDYTRAFAKRCPAKVLFFSSRQQLEEGLYLQGEEIMYADGRNTRKLLNIHEMKLLGLHNVENVMAAIGMALAYGVPESSVVKSVKEFTAVEHRIEYVATVRGVDYYNDSKGTNPDAAIKGIQAMNRKTVLIGGGYDKDSAYDEWIESFDGKVTWLVLLGQTKEKIADCARAHGFQNIILTDSLEEAVKVSALKAGEGEAVLLSPACASWGMFKNYEERGRMFKELVKKLEKEG
ncbi:MAG: UDP-N-acetylmuramoyl-L-alanine--D-glutamate ligase [Lachnospiraceae bacterium]|nr:UDP-N-acetylmuramoyl-L-alanine--D-glutamate ligase [Lachnospiraceae bacterium]